MSSVTAQGGFTSESFAAFLRGRDEPDWALDQRRRAWEHAESLPLPSTADEEWRRTDLRRFHLNRFELPGESDPSPAEPDALLTHGVQLAGRTWAHNSHPLEASLSQKWRDRGVLLTSLDAAIKEHADLVRPHLWRAFDREYDKFAALHAACWSGGTVLYVPAGVEMDEPIHMLSSLGEGGVDLHHTLVILEESAEATVLGETSGDAGAGLHLGGIELLVGPQARLRYVNLQNWGQQVWHFAHQKALVDRDARLQWTIGALGSKLAKVNQHVALTGEHAQAQVNGVMFTEGRQHINYHTHQHHQVPNTTSDLLYKGALQDDSRVVWRGMIKVDPAAQKTSGYQRDDNLILSDRARADSIPGLEIEADDVICTHGATAGRVDDELIFYCRTRGLTRNEAVRTVVAGFFQKVFDRITIESVREALGEAIGRRIREFH